uniref:SAM-dependent MTase RsmB/NOP-type domain-containing protein n=1 Tax=Nelumbo nucifera TaxID=4432 RepID=A0A822Z900_NELNU|nr:TPA_asm: hypothetical protein HUJ06_015383 [Nelumbo nucifera]
MFYCLVNKIFIYFLLFLVMQVPPLFLDAHPDHFVLDMCAAPGSKTFQLLEMIHQSTKPGSLPDGMVIANDVDVQRCNLLIHQTKRMCSANLIVTNHEAQHFPGCHLDKNCIDASDLGNNKDPKINKLLFDRVLCDVPCSGDGTLRKAPDIWRKWNAGMGNGLHRLQVLIAMRGLALLKVGGRMVYSTCSMNPVENEAVVAEVLRRCGGSVELLDVSSELPQLVHRPGLKKWKVRDKGIWLASYKDVPKYRRDGIMSSMFPSGRSFKEEKTVSDGPHEGIAPSDNTHETGNPNSSANGHQTDNNIESKQEIGQLESFLNQSDVSDEEMSSFPLERCMRIVPHDQNTGAFFIAVLRKLSSLPATLGNHTYQHGQLTSENLDLPKQLPDEIIKDTNGLAINPSEDGADNQYSETTSDVDLRDKPEGDSGPDSLGICEEGNEPEETQKDGSGETDHVREKQGKGRLQIQGKWRGVDPVVFFKDEATISSIKEFYGIRESFPLNGHLVTRNSDTHHVKRIYYVSESVHDVLKLNFHVGQQLKITSVGLKTFERQTSKEGTSSACAFRISSEGLPLLLPYITKQILCASLVDFKHLLQYRSIKFADFVDAEFGKKASNLMLGCCVIVLNKGDQISSDPIQVDASTLAIGCWKGRTSVSVMVSAIDCQELLQRLSVHFGGKEDSLMQEIKPSIVQEKAGQTMNSAEVDRESETVAQAIVG